jgi:hypothetical protein
MVFTAAVHTTMLQLGISFQAVASMHAEADMHDA